ncbi:MAG: hypothetical protein LBD02_02610 [Christensenellaceae bacterium]|jgi:hypothetical protein|nr:hypothetical protein [Christensenellaceae bacterium]
MSEDFWPSVGNFLSSNIAYILVGAGVLYFAFFIWQIVNSRRTGEGFSFKIKPFIGFLLILGFGVYCLLTGQDIASFIH